MRENLDLSIRILRGVLGIPLSTILAISMLPGPAGAARASLNHDAYADLIVGIPFEEISGQDFTGAITVFQSLPWTVSNNDVTMWHQNSTGAEDYCLPSEWFGESLATGDFDGDGYVDLSVGVPIENVGTAASAGIVQIFYGSREGITTDRDAIWHQGNPGVDGAVEEGDRFGSSQATGDFDGDGYADLAIGVPQEDIGDIQAAGAVNVLYGSASGIASARNVMFHQDKDGLWGDPETNDGFGSSLTTGDFDGDGFDDLVIGVPEEDIWGEGVENGGQIYVFYGGPTGLSTGDVEQWFPYNFGSGLPEAEDQDRFGYSLASGDFDGNGFDDLAIGIPYEGVSDLAGEAGAVQVMYGTAGGLSTTGAQFWHQDSPDVQEWAEIGDLFGEVLAAGDFDGNGSDDLAIGVPMEDVGSSTEVDWAGCVHVLYGSNPAGLSAAQNDLWDEDLDYVGNGAETGDRFGFSLAAGWLNTGYEYLAIGIPFQEVNGDSSAGAIQILYGSSSGLVANNASHFFHQDSVAVPGGTEPGDRFGHALATAGWSHALLFRDSFESSDTSRWSAESP